MLQDIADLDQEQKRIGDGVDVIRNLQDHPTAHGSVSFRWTYVNLSDAAWRSARDTGALGYMPYTTVQGLADLYGDQAVLTKRMRNLQFHEAELIAPLAAKNDKDPLSKDEYDATLIDATRPKSIFRFSNNRLKD